MATVLISRVISLKARVAFWLFIAKLSIIQSVSQGVSDLSGSAEDMAEQSSNSSLAGSAACEDFQPRGNLPNQTETFGHIIIL